MNSSSRTSDWWERFFASPDCIPLSFFPAKQETDAEVAGLVRMLGLRQRTRIADICCGAGRHLVPLARRGYDVTGLDISTWLLTHAKERAARRGLSPRLVLGDARALPFRDGAFDVAWNLFNSFGYCDTDEENQAILQEAARCLAPGGQFLLDTRNPQYQILFAPPRRTVRAAGKLRLVQFCTHERERHRLRVVWKTPEGQIVHYASFRLYQIEELRAMMQKAGLEEIGLYAGYDGRPFNSGERVLMYHARKPV
ncbi:MAG: methyltransferase domain-containing protein [candidate division WS1 bacterium]|nr:methyltransferase domain-containing protein [candidate division WS1 bacterium]